MGELSSTRRPTWETIRWQMFISCWLSRKRTLVSCTLPPTSMKVRPCAVDHDVGDVVPRQERFQRAIAEHVVDDVLYQMVLLGRGHGDVLDRHQFGDDVANLLRRRSG